MIKIHQQILRLFLLENWSFELQVKQPKILGHFYPFEFTVYIVHNALKFSTLVHNCSVEEVINHKKMEKYGIHSHSVV